MCIADFPEAPGSFSDWFSQGKSAIAVLESLAARNAFHGGTSLGPGVRSIHVGFELSRSARYIRAQEEAMDRRASSEN